MPLEAVSASHKNELFLKKIDLPELERPENLKSSWIDFRFREFVVGLLAMLPFLLQTEQFPMNDPNSQHHLKILYSLKCQFFDLRKGQNY